MKGEGAKFPWFYSDIPESDFDLLHDSIRTRTLSMGKASSLLEAAFARSENASHAIAVSSCTAALTLIGISLGMSSNDEVIIPNRTWIATAHSFSILGVRIRIADVNDNSIINEDDVSRLITTKTKAVVCVSLNGRTAVTSKIIDLCAKYGLTLIEDCAQSAGCDHHVSFSTSKGVNHIRAYSFSMTKLISAGQGGMVLVEDADLATKIRANRVHGIMSPDVITSWEQLGGNFRMTDLHASIAHAQLLRIDEKKLALMNTYNFYASNLQSDTVQLLPVNVPDNELPPIHRMSSSEP